MASTTSTPHCSTTGNLGRPRVFVAAPSAGVILLACPLARAEAVAAVVNPPSGLNPTPQLVVEPPDLLMQVNTKRLKTA